MSFSSVVNILLQSAIANVTKCGSSWLSWAERRFRSCVERTRFEPYTDKLTFYLLLYQFGSSFCILVLRIGNLSIKTGTIMYKMPFATFQN